MTNTAATIAVVGGGRMGIGIAQVFAAAGHYVVIAERDAPTASAALDSLRLGLRRAAERSALDGDVETVAGRVRTVDDLAALPADTDVLIEAVPEDARLKHDVLVAAEAVVTPGCLIATNTSSLSVSELAAALTHPDRFVGMHFFNPVPVSTLVEIVVATDTSDDTVTRTTGWVDGLGKKHIVVRDSPGFATSRLGVLLGLEAIRMLEEGLADAADIDTAMELGYRHPMGPLRSTDLVGLDVRLAIAEHLSNTLGERFTPPALLREKVARGELGRKSGRGFYDWP
jgi:3-hydroxybutyryl-CoA dehydrogenase